MSTRKPISEEHKQKLHDAMKKFFDDSVINPA